ncbi:MAG TPA: hypothetical protein ENJ34_03410 [Epsilonproteobacteria bacterium]|nr:hypothetical protein [Campylobacterota bacterium]
MSSEDKAIFNRVKNVNFIEVENAGGFIGHAYFRKNPAVLSDISLVIQNSSKPGTKGRPLIKKFGNFWLLKKNYPF